MRVAVLSDIHGFNLALERVLDEIAVSGPFDEIVVAGDLCETGPAPKAVLDRLRSEPVTIIQGNTDLDIVNAARLGHDTESLDFTVSQIGPDGVDFLSSLPFSRRISPPGGSDPSHDLLVVHANPRNMIEKIDPNMTDREIREVIGDERPGALAFGHIHICYTRTIDETRLVDVSAVGNPKDGDLRCKFGILTWNEESKTWLGDIVKLEYPLAQTEQQILNSDLPDPEKVLKKLKRARY